MKVVKTLHHCPHPTTKFQSKYSFAGVTTLSEQSRVVSALARPTTLVTGGMLAHTSFIDIYTVAMTQPEQTVEPSVFLTALSESHRLANRARLPRITRQQSSIPKLNQSFANSANSSLDLSRSKDTDASGWEAFLRSRAKQKIVQVPIYVAVHLKKYLTASVKKSPENTKPSVVSLALYSTKSSESKKPKSSNLPSPPWTSNSSTSKSCTTNCTTPSCRNKLI